MVDFYSHEQQDEFIYNLFKQKQNGTFLDIASGHPLIGSNTNTLEKSLGWTGYGFDICDNEKIHQWSQHRKTPFVQMDATSEQLTTFLKNTTNKTVDYISVDVDNAGTNLALQTLNRVLDAGIRFRAMTFEHECYTQGPAIRNQAAYLLESQGYIPLFSDVRHWTGGISDDSGFTFEDWWVDPKEFDSATLAAGGHGFYYYECIEALKAATGNIYQAHHRCCRAWGEEYDLFWHPEEERQIRQLVSQMVLER